MRRWLMNLGVLAGWIAPGVMAAAIVAGEPVVLKGGDRVVLIGGTLVEREAESGHLETRIARSLPGQTVVVRNLGWSGDTVEGVSHGKLNPARDGFRELVDHVAALKPTVVVLGYGANESYNGPGGLPAFAAGLDRLWGELAKTGARIVVLTPPRQENLGPPWPDPAAHNADLARYGDLLKAEAARRGATCVDLFAALTPAGPEEGGGPWTSNGIHLTPAGYQHAATAIAPALLGTPDPDLDPTIALADGTATATGATITDLAATPTGWKFRFRSNFLPAPPTAAVDSTMTPNQRRRTLRIAGLAPGRYALEVEGDRIVAPSDAARWRDGIKLTWIDPEVAQVEALRAKVVAKDRLYFHRWRPQNETYLFGMRKHEQGRNAAELAAFDPMIAAAEAEIARLSVPTPHTYELVRVPEGEVPR